MKEARYVIRLAHSNTYQPSAQAELLGLVRGRVHPLGGTAANLRVSSTAIEFDLFCPPSLELHPFLNALETLGAVLTCKRLDQEPASMVPGEVVAEARTLFNEQRFWEVHEVLEGLWKKTAGDEKKLLQGMILTAAALVHAQKNEPHVVFPMLQEAVLRLEDQPATYFGLDIRRFLLAIRKMILTKNIQFPRI